MKMKVLHVLTLSSWGGAPQVVSDIAKILDKDKFSIAIACGTGEGWERMHECGATVFPLRSLRRGISPIHDLKTFLELYHLMRQGRYDIVHCHSSKAGLLGRIAARLAGTKAIYFTAHGWGLYNHQEYGWAKRIMMASEKVAAKCSHKIVCVCESAKQDAIKWGIARPDRFVVVKNGASRSPHTDREGVRRCLNLGRDAVVLGMVGRLAYPKEPLMLLAAARRLIPKFRKAKFVLVGGGPLADVCADYVAKNRLEGNVLLLGEKPPEEARTLLLGFDAFVLASRFEGMPLTIIEAMFAGLPVVASNVGGVGELVQDGRNGLLFDSDDEDELVGKIEHLIRNPAERLRMGRAGQAMAELQFTAERMARQYEELYIEACCGTLGQNAILGPAAQPGVSARTHVVKAWTGEGG
jgi:glycosyltransferase involved in cell wall biosynthesis